MNGLLNLYQRAEQQARESNLARLKEVKGIYGDIAGLYAKGGKFGKGVEAQISRAKEQSVAQGMQALVGAGLANTTQAAGLGKKFEEEVGIPARLKLEDLRIGRLAEAKQGLAGVLERVNEPYPDYGALLSAMSAGASTYVPPQTSGGISVTEKLLQARRTNPYMRSFVVPQPEDSK